MSHKEYFKIRGETQAYQDMTCANGWAAPSTKHSVPKGGKVVRAEVAKADGSIKTNYYCEKCAQSLLEERLRIEASQNTLL